MVIVEASTAGAHDRARFIVAVGVAVGAASLAAGSLFGAPCGVVVALTHGVAYAAAASYFGPRALTAEAFSTIAFLVGPTTMVATAIGFHVGLGTPEVWLSWYPDGLQMGLAALFIFGLLFVPWLHWLHAAHAKLAQVPPRSFLGRVERRSLALPVALCAFLAGATSHLCWTLWDTPAAPGIPWAVGAIGAAALAALLVADGWAYRRACITVSRWRAAAPGDEIVDVEHVVDLGIGDDLRDIVAPSRSPYRDQDRRVARIRGDGDALLGALRRRVGFDAAALLVVIAVLLLFALDRGAVSLAFG